ncbi:MAG: hypothetical protein COA79_15190 [Planctomycetota bacterium]|nr:MAG: hypothetical protein COA79_15190 [Planctomycetota bacterium]
MKNKFYLVLLIFICLSNWTFSLDVKVFNENIDIAKKLLSNWHKSGDQEILEKAFLLLKNIRREIENDENQEQDHIDLKREIHMLYFWTNKSRQVNMRKRKYNLNSIKTNIDTPNTVIKKKIKLIDLTKNDPPHIRKALNECISFRQKYPTQVYSCEYMFREICFDFPKSFSAIKAKKLADKLNLKIGIYEKKEQSMIKEIKNEIFNFEKYYLNRNFEKIVKELMSKYDEEQDQYKKTIVGELITDYKYLHATMLAINELIQHKIYNPLSSSIIGFKFNGLIIGANKKGVSIKTNMGKVSIPWKKINDKQLGQLIGELSKGIDVSYKIYLSIYKLGNTAVGFDSLYRSTLNNPLVLTHIGRKYFKLIYHYKESIKEMVGNRIAKSKKLAANKDISGAISMLTKYLLEINKTKFNQEQVLRIHSVINGF